MSPSIRNNQRCIKDMTKPEHLLYWKKTLRISSIGLLLFAITLAAAWSLNRSLSIKHWDIVAPASLKADINNVLIHMEALDFWHSRPAHLRQKILSNVPDLADVQIQRQLPNSLIIHVTPRQAIALWLNTTTADKKHKPQAQLYLVDEHGVAYRARKDNEPSNLPVLRMPQKNLIAACQWLALLKKEQPEWFTRSSELFATRDGWKLNLVEGQQWYLPFGMRGLQTISQLSHILKQPRWRSGSWRIDTRLEKRWFLRPSTHEGVI